MKHKKYMSVLQIQRGFSLIELLLVITLFSVITGIVYPQLKGVYQSYVYENAINQLAQSIQYAKTQAVAHNSFVYLKIKSDDARYFFERERPDGRGGMERLGLEGRFGSGMALPGGMQFGSRTKREICFNPDGSADMLLIDVVAESGRRTEIKAHGYFAHLDVKNVSA